MRTTLDIDNDVLEATKELARRQNRSTGKVVSQILRNVLTGQATLAKEDTVSEAPSVAGFRPFPGGRAVVTNETVNRLRETEGI